MTTPPPPATPRAAHPPATPGPATTPPDTHRTALPHSAAVHLATAPQPSDARRGAVARGPGGRRAMTAHAAIAAEMGGRGRVVLSTLRSAPPLTLRQTGPERVHLVATAAGPLGGDRLRLDVRVGPGARLEVASVASTLVLPGRGESVMVVEAHVEAGGRLVFTPEPTVLAAGCRHRMVVRLTLAAGASAVWREEIVFGRYGEAPGRCHSRFDAVHDGRPLLRQEFVVGDPAVDGSPAVYGDARCVGSVLFAGDEPRPLAAEVGEGRAVLPLAGPGTLVSALAPDAVRLRERLALPAPDGP
ncbi:urease accessory protein UreD [Microtetraspora sp. NBRC 13810]|uniref:urease accessory protein UreD n=1 Tax=Microtetraspora sp. NBRC 13810 TaxID=3030990 RepID=UPI0024A5D3D7|nr:urease accessory protein UreD [Microtetraspora sp. NBRC 13810]GLW08610.1 urease accessory protein UreD [Microtetraspora sp. NBRC 13810]